MEKCALLPLAEIGEQLKCEANEDKLFKHMHVLLWAKCHASNQHMSKESAQRLTSVQLPVIRSRDRIVD